MKFLSDNVAALIRKKAGITPKNENPAPKAPEEVFLQGHITTSMEVKFLDFLDRVSRGLVR